MAKRKKQTKSKSSYFFRSLFIAGILFMLFAVAVKVNAASNLSFDSTISPSEITKSESKPERIAIPSVGIDLTTHETKIINKDWEINKDGASHLETSANPAEGGNIIIYAHNTKDRFGNLQNIKKGEFIKIYTNDAKIYTYEVKNILVVDPTQAELLQPTKKEVLTIYTCTGFADLKRLVIQATPKG
jgi:LPXTG-site transpeptidase (sortase) family protein